MDLCVGYGGRQWKRKKLKLNKYPHREGENNKSKKPKGKKREESGWGKPLNDLRPSIPMLGPQMEEN